MEGVTRLPREARVLVAYCTAVSRRFVRCADIGPFALFTYPPAAPEKACPSARAQESLLMNSAADAGSAPPEC